MKTIFILFLGLFWLVPLLAAEVVIVPLFNTNNWVAGLNIPLRVTGISLPASTIVVAEVVAGTIDAKECKVMRDPYISENFILRCQKDGTISLKLTVNPATVGNPYAKSTVLNYGPLTIKKLEGLQISDEGGGTDPNVIAGQQLFAAHCVECHSKSAKAGRSGNDVWNAIRNIGSMGKQSLLNLSRTEVEQISSYLKAP